MNITTFTEIAGVVLAFFALIFSFAKYRIQKKPRKIQEKLDRMDLQNKQEEEIAKRSASVNAKIIAPFIADFKIQVYNNGPAQAKNVDISYQEKHNWTYMSKFPISILNPEECVEMEIRTGANPKCTVKAILSWTDDAGDKKKDIILTLP